LPTSAYCTLAVPGIQLQLHTGRTPRLIRGTPAVVSGAAAPKWQSWGERARRISATRGRAGALHLRFTHGAQQFLPLHDVREHSNSLTAAAAHQQP